MSRTQAVQLHRPCPECEVCERIMDWRREHPEMVSNPKAPIQRPDLVLIAAPRLRSVHTHPPRR